MKLSRATRFQGAPRGPRNCYDTLKEGYPRRAVRAAWRLRPPTNDDVTRESDRQVRSHGFNHLWAWPWESWVFGGRTSLKACTFSAVPRFQPSVGLALGVLDLWGRTPPKACTFSAVPGVQPSVGLALGVLGPYIAEGVCVYTFGDHVA